MGKKLIIRHLKCILAEDFDKPKVKQNNVYLLLYKKGEVYECNQILEVTEMGIRSIPSVTTEQGATYFAPGGCSIKGYTKGFIFHNPKLIKM